MTGLTGRLRNKWFPGLRMPSAPLYGCTASSLSEWPDFCFSICSTVAQSCIGSFQICPESRVCKGTNGQHRGVWGAPRIPDCRPLALRVCSLLLRPMAKKLRASLCCLPPLPGSAAHRSSPTGERSSIFLGFAYRTVPPSANSTR